MERYGKRRRAVFAAALGPAAFSMAAVLSSRLVDDYRHRDEPISALAARGMPSAPLMVMGFLGLGAGTVALGSELRGSALPSSLPVALRIAGITTMVAGLARCSDRSCPVRLLGDPGATRSDDLHGAASMLTFILWGVMPLVAAARGRELHAIHRGVSALLGVTTAAAWGATGLLMRREDRQWSGLAQRLMVASALSWFPAAALAASSG
jgi:Protein of unknown function (DUF998)